jgi:hypothetical protein
MANGLRPIPCELHGILALEQEKLEASLSPAPRTERGARTVQGKIFEKAADQASEPQANIAHPKRMSAGAPQRPVHYPGDRPGRFVGRSAASTHARYQITSKPRQTPVLLSYPKFCLNILCASSLVIVEYSGCPLGR